jgi:LysR family transcriptional regulator, benzoate and cis,cis-muconate-responsive activator of ben and cat genes
MELRHLRYFLAVGEAANFTKAAAQLRVSQPALSRQMKDLEDEIGVDLLRRRPRGVTLTAEGKLFLEEVRELLKRTSESVEKVRALARDEHGLHVGYLRTHTAEILPPGLAAFRKSVPHAKVLLYDLSCDELVSGLRNATLELAIMLEPTGEQAAGIEFELLRTYPFYVAVAPAHPFARLKSIPLEKVAAEPLIGLYGKHFPEYHRNLNRIFAPIGAKPRVAVECDSGNSLLIEVEAGRGIALSTPIFKLVTGNRLVYRPLTGTTESVSIGIARATKRAVTSAGEKFSEILRKTSDGATTAKAKPGKSSETGRTRNVRAVRALKPLDAPVITGLGSTASDDSRGGAPGQFN